MRKRVWALAMAAVMAAGLAACGGDSAGTTTTAPQADVETGAPQGGQADGGQTEAAGGASKVTVIIKATDRTGVGDRHRRAGDHPGERGGRRA